MIEIQGLTKVYGKHSVLQDISLTFTEGCVYGLVGPNGCGKTTLMRCICGFTRPTQGRVLINGKQIGKDVDFAPATGVIIETPGFIPYFSGKRNLTVLANISRRADEAKVESVIRQVGLDPANKIPVKKYSLGMRQRLGIAQAIIEDPDILILDEPFNGLDKKAMGDIRRLFQELKARGKIIILASHYANEIEENCDKVFEMAEGVLLQIHQ